MNCREITPDYLAEIRQADTHPNGIANRIGVTIWEMAAMPSDEYLATVRPGHERLTEPSRTHADFIIADATAAVRLEDPQAVVRLAAPVLAHPLLQPLLDA